MKSNGDNPFFKGVGEYDDEIQFRAPRLNKVDLEELLEFSFSDEYQQ